MNFNDHSNLKDTHAPFSASKYHWIRYSDDKMIETLDNITAAAEGVIKHNYAAQAISLKRKQGGANDALKMHINDAIGYRMTPEVLLYYSPWFYGTADAIGCSLKKSILRIHDLKNGISRSSMDQLLIYAALFFLEYQIRPHDIETKLRIYQSGEIIKHEPDLDEIIPIMDKIVYYTKIFESRSDY